MNRKRLMKHLVVIFAAALTLLILASVPVLTFQSLSQSLSLSIPTITQSPSHQIVSNSLQLHEVWRRVIGPIYSTEVGYGSAVSNGVIALPIFSDKTHLTAFDTRTGQPLWSEQLVTPQYPDDPRSVDSIFVDGDQVFVAVPFVIRSFRLADGQPNWMTESLPGHAGYDIYPEVKNKALQVYSTLEDRLIYYIGVNDGHIGSIEKYSRTLLLNTSAVQYYDDYNGLSGVDRVTGKVLWQSTIKDQVRGWPVFVNPDTMIVATGSVLGTLSAINSSSGQMIWQTPDESVISNFVVVNYMVYSISPDSSLIGRDALTGQQKGLLQFSGSRLNATDASNYFVFTDNAMLFVYLGDSQELIAFSLN